MSVCRHELGGSTPQLPTIPTLLYRIPWVTPQQYRTGDTHCWNATAGQTDGR